MATRQGILDASIELWARGGWRSTGLAAVAELAGVTQGNVLHHFGTKENLLLAVVKERDRQEGQRLQGLMAAPGLEGLRRLREVARANEERPGLSQLFVMLEVENLDGDGPVHDYYLRRNRALREGIAAALRDAQGRGEVRPGIDPDVTAVHVLAFMEGANMVWLLDRERVDLTEVYDAFVESLFRDLAPGD